MVKLKSKLEGLKENEPLFRYTTFKIGGPAKYFYIARNSRQLIAAAKTAQELNLPWIILSGGSNVLVADQGFPGLVIKAENRQVKIVDNQVEAESGIMLNKLVSECCKQGLSGLEWAAGIPGSLGGAIRANAGAYQKEIKDLVLQVDIWDGQKEKQLKKEECGFSYRQSIFKHNDQYLILFAKLQLTPGDREKIQSEVNQNVNKRQESQPYDLPSAGCIFKNPKNKSAGQLIEQAGLKGQKIGQAMVSPKHANFIVNTGSATAEQVIMLISLIKQKVRVKFAIQLQEEIEMVGF